MTDTQSLERLVRVEVIVDEMRGDLKDLIRKIDGMDTRIRAAEDSIRDARVGWKVILAVGTGAMTIAGTIGAFVGKWLPFFGGMPK